MSEAQRDQNFIPSALGVSSSDGVTTLPFEIDSITGRLLVDSSAGAELIVGTTTITGGATTRILYDNAGVLGEYTISGSGTVVAMATAPTFSTSITGSYLTASEILITDGSKNIISAAVATYPSLTELTYVKGVTSSIQTQLNAKGVGTVTTVSVVTANGVSGSVATATTTPAITLTLGAITPTTVNGLTITANGTNTLNITAAKTLVVTHSLTLSGTDSTVMTFPTTTATIARTDAGQTFTGVQVFTLPTIAGATMTGNFNYAAVPASDHSANGRTLSAFNLGATIALMDLVYLGSSSKWLLTDADAAATAGGVLIGICLDGGDDTDTTTIAMDGLVRDDTWNWTPGAPLYIDTATPGQLTATQPSGTDDVIRVVGFAVTADVIWLNPSPDYITHT